MENLAWRKARASAVNGDCVEVGTSTGTIAGIRDSKSPERGMLTVTPEAFALFLMDIRAGAYGL